MRINHTPCIRRSVLVVGVLASIAAGPLSAPATAESAPPVPNRPAFLGGPLDLFRFGASQGLPLGCTVGLSTAELVTTETLGAAAGTVSQGFGQANDACGEVAAAGAEQVVEGQSQVAPLAPVLNPIANPVIESMATSVEQAAPLYQTALAPAGGTVYDLGETLRYFLGS